MRNEFGEIKNIIKNKIIKINILKREK